jgi:hypothetical protein
MSTLNEILRLMLIWYNHATLPNVPPTFPTSTSPARAPMPLLLSILAVALVAARQMTMGNSRALTRGRTRLLYLLLIPVAHAAMR